jgi:hypothetical protein
MYLRRRDSMRLLILTATAGEGHNSLSHALKDYIRKYHHDGFS